MIDVYHIAGATIAIAPIVGEGSRRERECATVHSIISHIFGKPLTVEHDADGAPLIDAAVNISITHSRDIAAVAVCRHCKVGIDAEQWRQALVKTSTRFLSTDEQDRFTQPEQLLRAWTIKEAVYKIVGKQAVEFASAIDIAADMASASCMGHTFELHTFTHGSDTVTLALL